MQPGSYWAGFDLAVASLYAFYAFFIGLVLYINRESKREGYPLVIPGVSGSKGRPEGFPPMPPPKVYKLIHGGTAIAPRPEDPQPPLAAIPSDRYAGSPLIPTGDPMVDQVGPASYALRRDEPDLTFDDSTPKIRPLRTMNDVIVDPADPDPRGMPVLDADGIVAGTCTDLWIDRSEAMFRYLEVQVPLDDGSTRQALIPVPLSKVDPDWRVVKVKALRRRHFATIPALRNPDIITLLEEDKIQGYVAGGHLYAKPSRQEPLL
jgi:photosynthetic reaction center H subunit